LGHIVTMKLNDIKERKQSLISIVDDEACVRESLSSLIRSVGYKVEEFASAEDFLLEGKWDETACLILDVRLLGMGGLELQRRLAEMGREHPPIVFISGHATEKEQAWAATGGAVAFLRKPFSDELLLNAVRDSVARARAETTPAILFSFFGGAGALTANRQAMPGTRQKV
jgi:FixJ family two-component response regulator